MQNETEENRKVILVPLLGVVKGVRDGEVVPGGGLGACRPLRGVFR